MFLSSKPGLGHGRDDSPAHSSQASHPAPEHSSLIVQIPPAPPWCLGDPGMTKRTARAPPSLEHMYVFSNTKSGSLVTTGSLEEGQSARERHRLHLLPCPFPSHISHIHSYIHSFILCLSISSIHPSIHSCTHSSLHPCIHSSSCTQVFHSFVHLSINILVPGHFIHLFIHPLTPGMATT